MLHVAIISVRDWLLKNILIIIKQYDNNQGTDIMVPVKQTK